MRTHARILSLCLALGAALPALADPATLTVTGQGRIAATPDMATVSLGVEYTAAEPLLAVNQTSEAVDAIMAKLTEMGIAPRDMQTANLSVGEVWNRTASGDNEVSGYRASNLLRVRVRDLDGLGEILQTVLESGANDLSGLSFGLTDPRPVEDKARRAAVADALAKAQLYAEAAGMPLGPILSIEEGGSLPEFRYTSARSVEAMADVPVAAGETVVSDSVTVVFSLGE
ncbi:SIMPL domain-containing protein [Tropicibacter naphthalenivorans]|uniref:26 kDa periplasmic immunogenic protein n=1 Tax=Tropicibacter naphthalenivorans TaxID=441103 RepID=A0A0P1G3T8_9RHOB|nr:SIMPL domain-containing protein [Tropicibacter naphthalenivorans]CUH76492.1 26 kDa periplasmic immunogenic protein precursor [Tropicibacter naphthalenivorans]SMC65785.1 hypothetical protein SAMN04488093_102654 [Tropicibacter naphthalenivorans]